jgi:hypothetical protein
MNIRFSGGSVRVRFDRRFPGWNGLRSISLVVLEMSGTRKTISRVEGNRDAHTILRILSPPYRRANSLARNTRPDFVMA